MPCSMAPQLLGQRLLPIGQRTQVAPGDPAVDRKAMSDEEAGGQSEVDARPLLPGLREVQRGGAKWSALGRRGFKGSNARSL